MPAYEDDVDIQFEDPGAWEVSELSQAAGAPPAPGIPTFEEPAAPGEQDAGTVSVPARMSRNGPQVMPIKVEEQPDTDLPAFDWLTEVAIPLAIFGMLGCLLYFIIDLGEARGLKLGTALRWVCFWFLLAVILITRIRTKYGGAALALPYLLGLIGAIVLFVARFTFDPTLISADATPAGQLLSFVFNLALVGLVGWSAYRVTRECTLEENVAFSMEQGFITDLTGPAARPGSPAAGPQHPGRIILWVTLAGLIAFGLGWSRLGVTPELARHGSVCVAGYMFFALVLLTLTNLSAIRMGIRQRRAVVSRSLAPTWIAASVALALIILALPAPLPRLLFLPAPFDVPAYRPKGQHPSGQDGGRGQQASMNQQANDARQAGGGSAGKGGQARAQTESQSTGVRAPWWWWLLLLLLAAVLLYLLYRYRRRVAAFLHAVWAALAAFWQRLRERLGWRRRPLDDEFSDLPEDPFADLWGQLDLIANMTPAQIVRHVYRAFLAFCALRGYPRADHVTEYEFLRTVPPRIGLPEEDQRNLTGAYVVASYSPLEVSARTVEMVRDIWERLRPAIESARSAQSAQAARA